jgi:hypothetical protein
MYTYTDFTLCSIQRNFNQPYLFYRYPELCENIAQYFPPNKITYFLEVRE